MKMYRVINGIIHTGEAPDGAMTLELGSQSYAMHDGDGNPPIVMIDYENRVYRRDGGEPMPFPARFYRNDDVRWERDS